MRIGSLFAGLGGLDLACQWAFGGRTVWQLDQVGAKVRAHLDSVSGYVKASRIGGIMSRLKKLTVEQAEESVRLYQSGLGLSPIARFFGVSRQSMWDLLRRRITLRERRRLGVENCLYRGGVRADPEAHDLVERAILAGVLHRPAICSLCLGSGKPYKDGRSPIQAHHDDYNHPLVVRWLPP